MVLTGSKVPGPTGESAFTLTPGMAPGDRLAGRCAALPKPWVMATTPGRRVSSMRAGGLERAEPVGDPHPGPVGDAEAVGVGGGEEQRVVGPGPFFSRSTFCRAVLMVCDVRRVISLSWSVGLGEQLVEQRPRPARGPGASIAGIAVEGAVGRHAVEEGARLGGRQDGHAVVGWPAAPADRQCRARRGLPS